MKYPTIRTLLSYVPLFFQAWLFSIASVIVKDPNLRWYLGKIKEEQGNLQGAIIAYESAVDMVKNPNKTLKQPNLQLYQFSLARALYKAGEAHPDDPIFHCYVKPLEDKVVSRDGFAGSYDASFKYNGLVLDINLDRTDFEYFELLINGNLFRRIKVIPNIKQYNFKVKRPALAHFPVSGVINVHTSDGNILLANGSSGLKLSIQHGLGDIEEKLKQYGMIDKKGYIPSSNSEIRERQNDYLKLYAEAKDFFDKEIGIPLFLIYGTLLGYYRDGDFIPGDDDFDVCYISEKNDPRSVKEEAKAIIKKLIQEGFTVSFNPAGRPFRLRNDNNTSTLHLDVRPLWFQGGKVWAHKQACLPCTLEDFKPVQKAKLRNHEVYIPSKPDVFLEAYYGPGWKVPDPSYSNETVRVDPVVRKNLAKACLTLNEYYKMHDELEILKGEYSNMGKLIYTAAHDLYPLEEYEKNCGW